MRPFVLTFAAAAMLLQACDQIVLPPSPLPPADSCGAAQLQTLVGRPVAILPDAGPWSTLRVIYPGQAVTMDYSATRLNAEVNASGTILRLFCG